MKKILLTTAATAIIATSSICSASFYIKGQAGMSNFNDVSVKSSLLGENSTNLSTEFTDLKFKSKNTGFAGAAVGYNIMENARVEIAFDHFFNPTSNFSTNLTEEIITPIASVITCLTQNIPKIELGLNVKSDINTLMINGFVDVFDADIFKIFVGAGVGMSQITTTIKPSLEIENTTNSDMITQLQKVIDEKLSTEQKFKKKDNLAFAAHIGAAYEIADGVHAELTYSYKHLGKAFKDDDAPELKSHNIGVGIRFNM